MCFIQRECSETLLKFVQEKNPFFEYMGEGIAHGNILPCIRRNEIHFYEGGARLFRFRAHNVFTHERYIDEDGTRDRVVKDEDRVVTHEEQTPEVFDRVRKTARTHRADNPRNELAAVQALFPAFAVTRCNHDLNELALIDVEARFGRDEARGLPGRMIDLVFLMPDHRLLFVEAKCMGNPDIAAIGQANVEAQVKDYERHIEHDCVLGAINRSIEGQNKLLDRKIELATGIFPRVPILLLDPGKPQLKIGPRNRWLSLRLEEADSWTVDSERPRVIDGRCDPTAAIKGFVEKFGSSRAA